MLSLLSSGGSRQPGCTALAALASAVEWFCKTAEARPQMAEVLERVRLAVSPHLCAPERLAEASELGARYLDLLYRAALFCSPALFGSPQVLLHPPYARSPPSLSLPSPGAACTCHAACTCDAGAGRGAAAYTPLHPVDPLHPLQALAPLAPLTRCCTRRCSSWCPACASRSASFCARPARSSPASPPRQRPSSSHPKPVPPVGLPPAHLHLHWRRHQRAPISHRYGSRQLAAG